MTYDFGFRFVWIDSLCIWQDDTGDWRHEGSRMNFIYAGAVLTLAASRSASANKGLFVNDPSKCSREMQWTSQGPEQAWGIHARVSFEHGDLDSEDMILLQRAWVLQERLLSKRVVHFTSNEILWECWQGTTCECSLLFDMVGQRRSTLLFQEHIQDSAKLWYDLVQEYSKKQLSFQKDIYPALQGIAKRVKQVRRNGSN